MRSRVEEFAEIRRAARVEGLSINALAKRFRVHRRTVRQALESAEPPARKTPVRAAPKLDGVRELIDGMLRQDIDAPRKQRQTATRIWHRLLDEHGADVGYPTVRDYVRWRRPEILGTSGVSRAMVPQEHAPGAEAEVDFGELWVILAGVKTKCYMFAFRLSHSGRAVHRVYPTQALEAFLEGHIDAFEELGGVPTLQIKYDNLSPAVTQVLSGRARVETTRWALFRSHYGFDAFYCEPGINGAHEKGGIEGEVGRFRRTWLSPMPVVASLAELNARIREWDLRDERRRIGQKISTVAQDLSSDREHLAQLPRDRFDPGLELYPRVDRSGLVTVRQAKYSVPVRLIGRKLRVSLRASELVVFDGRQVVARHERVIERYGQSVQLDHYLEVLQHKPGALGGSTALAHARNTGAFTGLHEGFWAESRKVNGDAAGTRELIDVLLLHRTMPTPAVLAGISAALTVGAVTADVVAVEARLAAAQLEKNDIALIEAPTLPKVVSLTQRRLTDPAAVIAGLPQDNRPLPSVAGYDALLTKRAAKHAVTASMSEGASGA
ncbi:MULTISPECIES: IS21 family transposase [Microbacterium]|uniref:IS21 family transposase n=1 Tax=Microbacterium TaxID=33882 RepID=UPI000E809033|nr:IS21 family transposase [Microbacterium proteolyticum]HBS74185.1 IS21 family transposase [Microbacterium sp.]